MAKNTSIVAFGDVFEINSLPRAGGQPAPKRFAIAAGISVEGEVRVRNWDEDEEGHHLGDRFAVPYDRLVALHRAGLWRFLANEAEALDSALHAEDVARPLRFPL